MRNFITTIAILVTGSFAFASTQQCSQTCKAGLIDAEFEFAYHSGYSSVGIAENVFQACGENKEIEKECAKLIRPDEGTIVYMYYAGCVHERVKKVCEDLYDADRLR